MSVSQEAVVVQEEEDDAGPLCLPSARLKFCDGLVLEVCVCVSNEVVVVQEDDDCVNSTL